MTAINVNQDKASLYKKILKVMGKVERIPKNGYNSFHKYAYTTESDLVDATRKLMVEEGLVVFNNVREYEIKGELATVTIDFTLCDVETGESVTTCLVGQGTDKGDKAFYKAYAGATKYYLMKTFLIPTGDDPEADVSTDKNAYRKNTAPKPRQNQKPKQPQNQAKNNITENKVTDAQISMIQQKIQEVLQFIDRTEEEIIDQLKERYQFVSLQEMNTVQAMHCVETLKKWKTNYENLNNEPQQ